MKLRYLNIRHYPPLTEARIAFSSTSPLQRKCAIRFVVGVNGSGKTHLLQAVSEVFLALADWRAPHFPVNLVYELGEKAQQQTIVLSALRGEGQERPSLWVSETFTFPGNTRPDDFEALIQSLHASPEKPPETFRAVIAPGTWSGGSVTAQIAYLPRTVLAYTTGSIKPWQELWDRNADTEGINIVSQAENYDTSQERPAGWTVELELGCRPEEDLEGQTGEATSSSSVPETPSAAPPEAAWLPTLVTPQRLKFALLAVALPIGLKDSREDKNAREEGDQKILRDLLGRSGWLWPLSITVRLDFQPTSWRQERIRHVLRWFYAAGEVVAEPSPSSMRTLHFDLQGPFEPDVLPSEINDTDLRACRTQGEALLSLIGGENTSAFKRFERLCELHDDGLISDIGIALRKDDTEDIIRFDELSDGEQMVIGRMVLFHLLRDQSDALLLLDEPETHFNDKWKREIVDIIDEAIGQTANDVFISTHSAIVLTDVFNDEIIMTRKTTHGSEVVSVQDKTFATDPSELMIRVFGAEDSVGKRAQEFIENTLKQTTGSQQDIEIVKALVERMGSGFYRTELRTLISKWERQGGNGA